MNGVMSCRTCDAQSDVLAMARRGGVRMFGCLFVAWLLFMASLLLLFVLGVAIEYPQLAVVAAVVLGFWWLARRAGARKSG